MRPLLCLGLCLGLWSMLGAASPRQNGEQVPIISVETDLVTLPVTVVDRDGRFVTGLQQNHFTVYDNGEPQTIQFFTSEDVPATVGIVVDNSSSMRGRREDVNAAAMAFAAMSHPLDELFALNFNEMVWLSLPGSVPFTNDPDQLRTALSTVLPRGMTALYDAVDRALDHLQRGRHDRKALIVVSDGGDNASAHTLAAVLEHARRAEAAIYSVTLFDPDNHDARPRVLKRLASETGGSAFTPRRTDDVKDSFAQIARELRSRYTIGFVPADSGSGFRPVRVVADAGDHRQLTVRTRAGYYAGPSHSTR